jgi:hypothetical protein
MTRRRQAPTGLQGGAPTQPRQREPHPRECAAAPGAQGFGSRQQPARPSTGRQARIPEQRPGKRAALLGGTAGVGSTPTEAAPAPAGGNVGVRSPT